MNQLLQPPEWTTLLDAQIEQLKDAKCNRIYQEKVSGVNVDRPELVAMLDYVREGDCVVVTKLDRIARSTKHLLEIIDLLKEKKVVSKVLNINFDTCTPTGKLMQTMFAAVAEFEREMMLERQAEGIRIAKAKGKFKGRKPTAREKSGEVLQLLADGLTKEAVRRRWELEWLRCIKLPRRLRRLRKIEWLKSGLQICPVRGFFWQVAGITVMRRVRPMAHLGCDPTIGTFDSLVVTGPITRIGR